MATKSVLVIERSAMPASVSVSVAELFAAVGSVVLAGVVTVAVLTKLATADDCNVAVSVNVAVAPTVNQTLLLMLPVPDAWQEPEPVTVQAQVAPLSDAGRRSATVAPTTSDGPRFDTEIVYVTAVPGVAVAEKSVLVIARSATGFRVSVSVAELLPGTVSMTPAGTVAEAVLADVPTADAATVAVTSNVAVPPASRSTDVLMLADPEAWQVEPAEAVHVHVGPTSVAGIGSVTVAPATLEGPLLVTTIV